MQERSQDKKKNAVIERVRSLEEEIAKARQYLDDGTHAHWHKFRPLFVKRVYADGKLVPPHRGWVENVFIPRKERALLKAEKLLERLERAK